MKHTRGILLLLLFVLLGMLSSLGFAYDGQTFTENGITYTEFSGKYTVTGYTGTDTHVIIPDVVNGKIVDQIGSWAFYNKTSLITIALPDTIMSIQSRAFSNCTSLSSMTIPVSVKSIGEFAFSGCSSITNVIIPNGVTSIEAETFSKCTSLTSVTIPNSVTRIEAEAFSKCSNLTSLTIPSSVTSIGIYAFNECSSLAILTIPAGVTSIEAGTFSGCNSLTSLTIPDDVKIIGSYAFSYCKSLMNLTIPDDVTSIGDGAFWGCSGLTSLTIPDGVTSFGNSVFSECNNLTSAILPSSLTSIGDQTFNGCSSLLSLTIPNGVTSIGDRAFSGCSSLTTLTIPDGVTRIGESAFTSCGNLTSMTIPDAVTNIGKGAFSGCSNLMNITIPNGVTSIESGTFSGCTSLISLTVPDGVMSIKDGAFSGCNSLANVTLPKSLRSIGKYAFSECKSLTNLTIPYGVTSINERAFMYCSNLTSLTLPNSLTSISEYAFYGCWSLTSLIIPDGVTSIGNYSFSSCGSLTNLTLPSSLKSIGRNAFEACSNLSNLTISDGVTDIDYNAFSPQYLRTIYGYSGSSAETYANIRNIQFIPLDTLVFTVKFETNATTLIDNKEVIGGSNLSGIPSLYNQKWVFDGWYKDPVFIQLFDVATNRVESDLTLYAKWVYQIKFDPMGGSPVPPNIKITTPEALSSPTVPTRLGYIFDGWYREKAFNTKWNFDVDVANESMTLYAKWIPNKYTVTFSSPYETLITSLQVDYDATIPEPIKPIQEGFTFIGWYRDSSFSILWDFSSNKMTFDRTLYAKWQSKGNEDVGVTFHTMGGSTIPGIVQTKNTLITAPTAPTRTGYTFDGWFTEDEYVNPWNFSTDTVTGDINLYAKWTINQYTVSFDSQEGRAVESKITDYNTVISAPTEPVRTGYTFAGWYQEESLINVWDFTSDVVTTDTTLYAKWTINQYTVSFDSQEGSVVDSKITDYNTLISAPTDPERTGYMFAGWYQEESLINAWDFSSDVVTTDMTLYAKWTVNQYTISFDSQEGSVVDPIVTDYNTLISEPTEPERTGYTFGGWYLEESLNNAWDFTSDAVTSDMTLYAKWTINQYTVSFDSQVSSTLESVMANYNALISAPTEPERTNYIFGGWYQEESLTNVWDFTSDLVTSDMTLYAKWTIITYSVDWVGGPGANNMPSSQEVDINGLLPKPPVPTRGYQTFAGWSTDSALTKVYDFNRPVTGNMTLYAKWVPGTYLYFWVDGSTSTVPRQYIKFMEYTKKPVDPVKAGYRFAGWYTDQTYQTEFTFGKLMPYLTIAYAKWETITYTVDWVGGPGANDMPSSQVMEANSLLTKPPVPTRGYQTFAGWYSDNALTKAYDFSQPVTRNMTIYAKWVPGTYLYFWVDGSTSLVPRQYIKYMEYSKVPVAPTKAGFTFGGWYEDQAYTKPYEFNTLLPYMKVVYAKWNPESHYTIDWMGGPGANNMPSQQVVASGTRLSQPSVPLRGYQTFGGWYTDSGLTKPFDFTQPIRANTTLYARWVPGTYLYFWVDGSTSAVPRQHIKYMEYTQKPADPVKQGYVFSGWYTDQSYTTEFTFGRMMPYLTIAYAKFDFPPVQTVTEPTTPGPVLPPVETSTESMKGEPEVVPVETPAEQLPIETTEGALEENIVILVESPSELPPVETTDAVQENEVQTEPESTDPVSEDEIGNFSVGTEVAGTK